MLCISLAKFQIIWNGETTTAFTSSRGLRQGDPISPYLFVLCLERLGHMIEEKVEEGRWNPVSLSREGPQISHLCFVDDLILFVKVEAV